MKKHLSHQGSHHKGHKAGHGAGHGVTHSHKYGSHVPTVKKDAHAHRTHHAMNKAHGTPRGFATDDEGYQDAPPPAGIKDDADDHCNSMTEY